MESATSIIDGQRYFKVTSTRVSGSRRFANMRLSIAGLEELAELSRTIQKHLIEGRQANADADE